MNKKPRILLIRTLETIEAATAYLHAKHIDVVPVPLMRAKKQELEACLVRQRFSDCDGVICLSQNAANNLLRYQGMLKQQDMYAIGNSTAETLTKLFKKVQIPKEHTSEGLLALLSATNLEERRLLIVKGKGGRNWLQPQLQKRGAHLQSLDLYERVPCSPAILNQPETIEAIDAIFVTSGELLLAATRIWGEQLRDHLWLVPGVRVQELAKRQGINRCINVGSASTTSMYTAFTQEVE